MLMFCFISLGVPSTGVYPPWKSKLSLFFQFSAQMILFLIIWCKKHSDRAELMMSGTEFGCSVNAEEANLITAQAETTDESHLRLV